MASSATETSTATGREFVRTTPSTSAPSTSFPCAAATATTTPAPALRTLRASLLPLPASAAMPPAAPVARAIRATRAAAPAQAVAPAGHRLAAPAQAQRLLRAVEWRSCRCSRSCEAAAAAKQQRTRIRLLLLPAEGAPPMNASSDIFVGELEVRDVLEVFVVDRQVAEHVVELGQLLLLQLPCGLPLPGLLLQPLDGLEGTASQRLDELGYHLCAAVGLLHVDRVLHGDEDVAHDTLHRLDDGPGRLKLCLLVEQPCLLRSTRSLLPLFHAHLVSGCSLLLLVCQFLGKLLLELRLLLVECSVHVLLVLLLQLQPLLLQLVLVVLLQRLQVLQVRRCLRRGCSPRTLRRLQLLLQVLDLNLHLQHLPLGLAELLLCSKPLLLHGKLGISHFVKLLPKLVDLVHLRLHSCVLERNIGRAGAVRVLLLEGVVHRQRGLLLVPLLLLLVLR
mmetsp:Transcript_11532/g.46631  ORF Transcript_11532/g.46631 Transcript_11532/m.46631 type:complete len:449 (-) Transcript_11532:1120-2466(-)